MYLSNLSDKQKLLFLDLALFSMEIDGVIADKELEMLHQFCEEMKIEFRNSKNYASYEEVASALKDISTTSELKKMTIELIALIYADGKYADEEADLLKYVQKTFQFSPHLMEDLIYNTRNLLNSCDVLNNMVK